MTLEIFVANAVKRARDDEEQWQPALEHLKEHLQHGGGFTLNQKPEPLDWERQPHVNDVVCVLKGWVLVRSQISCLEIGSTQSGPGVPQANDWSPRCLRDQPHTTSVIPIPCCRLLDLSLVPCYVE
jgi:hypothetical protein